MTGNGPGFVEFKCNVGIVGRGLVLGPPICVRNSCKFWIDAILEVKEALENFIGVTMEGDAMRGGSL